MILLLSIMLAYVNIEILTIWVPQDFKNYIFGTIKILIAYHCHCLQDNALKLHIQTFA